MNKVCIRCKEKKDYRSFCKDRTKKDGLQSYCRKCLREYHRIKYLDGADKYYKKKQKEYKKRFPEKVKAWKKKYCNENADYLNAKHKEHREKLSSYYVRDKLKRQGFLPENITPEIIDIKRNLIKMQRIFKKIKEV
jgi:hypothetical protein